MPSRERVITVIIDGDSENDETNIVSEVIDFTDEGGNVKQKQVSKLSSLLQCDGAQKATVPKKELTIDLTTATNEKIGSDSPLETKNIISDDASQTMQSSPKPKPKNGREKSSKSTQHTLGFFFSKPSITTEKVSKSKAKKQTQKPLNTCSSSGKNCPESSFSKENGLKPNSNTVKNLNVITPKIASTKVPCIPSNTSMLKSKTLQHNTTDNTSLKRSVPKISQSKHKTSRPNFLKKDSIDKSEIMSIVLGTPPPGNMDDTLASQPTDTITKVCGVSISLLIPELVTRDRSHGKTSANKAKNPCDEKQGSNMKRVIVLDESTPASTRVTKKVESKSETTFKVMEQPQELTITEQIEVECLKEKEKEITSEMKKQTGHGARPSNIAVDKVEDNFACNTIVNSENIHTVRQNIEPKADSTKNTSCEVEIDTGIRILNSQEQCISEKVADIEIETPSLVAKLNNNTGVMELKPSNPLSSKNMKVADLQQCDKPDNSLQIVTTTNSVKDKDGEKFVPSHNLIPTILKAQQKKECDDHSSHARTATPPMSPAKTRKGTKSSVKNGKAAQLQQSDAAKLLEIDREKVVASHRSNSTSLKAQQTRECVDNFNDTKTATSAKVQQPDAAKPLCTKPPVIEKICEKIVASHRFSVSQQKAEPTEACDDNSSQSKAVTSAKVQELDAAKLLCTKPPVIEIDREKVVASHSSSVSQQKAEQTRECTDNSRKSKAATSAKVQQSNAAKLSCTKPPVREKICEKVDASHSSSVSQQKAEKTEACEDNSSQPKAATSAKVQQSNAAKLSCTNSPVREKIFEKVDASHSSSVSQQKAEQTEACDDNSSQPKAATSAKVQQSEEAKLPCTNSPLIEIDREKVVASHSSSVSQQKAEKTKECADNFGKLKTATSAKVQEFDTAKLSCTKPPVREKICEKVDASHSSSVSQQKAEPTEACDDNSSQSKAATSAKVQQSEEAKLPRTNSPVIEIDREKVVASHSSSVSQQKAEQTREWDDNSSQPKAATSAKVQQSNKTKLPCTNSPLIEIDPEKVVASHSSSVSQQKAEQKKTCDDDSSHKRKARSMSPEKVRKKKKRVSPATSDIVRELTKEEKSIIKQHEEMEKLYTKKLEELVKRATNGEFDEEGFQTKNPKKALGEMDATIIPSACTAGEFRDEWLPGLALVVQGSSLPLISLARLAHNQIINESPNSAAVISINAVMTKIKLIATRTQYLLPIPSTISPTEKIQVDIYSNTDIGMMWRWELSSLDLIDTKHNAAVKRARSARKRVKSHQKSILRLISTLNTFDKQIKSSSKDSWSPQIAKINAEEEKVLKYERDEEKARLILSAKVQKEKERTQKQLEKQKEKERVEDEKRKEKALKDEQKQEKLQQKLKEAEELKKKKELKIAEGIEQANRQKARLMSFFKSPSVSQKNNCGACSTGSTYNKKSDSQNKCKSGGLSKDRAIDSDKFWSTLGYGATSLESCPFLNLSNKAKLSRRKKSRKVRVQVFVTVGSENAFEQQPYDEERIVLIRNKYKYLSFHEDSRPPYYGTWSKEMSTEVTGRRPFGKDTKNLDYDFDSEAEWEEGDDEHGEDCSVNDNEDDEIDDEEGDCRKYNFQDGWLTQDDDLGLQDEDEDEETMVMRRKKIAACNISENITKGTKFSPASVVGPIMGGLPQMDTNDNFSASDIDLIEGINRSDARALILAHEVIPLQPSINLCLDAYPPMVESDEPKIDVKKSTKMSSQDLTDEDLKTFAKFVHRCTLKSKDIVVESLRSTHKTLTSSRAQATRKLDLIATKRRLKNGGGVIWEVKDDVLKQLGLEDLIVKTDEQVPDESSVKKKKSNQNERKKKKDKRKKSYETPDVLPVIVSPQKVNPIDDAPSGIMSGTKRKVPSVSSASANLLAAFLKRKKK